MNAPSQLHDLGQSLRLDNITRGRRVVMPRHGFRVEHLVSTAKAVLATNRMPGHGSRD